MMRLSSNDGSDEDGALLCSSIEADDEEEGLEEDTELDEEGSESDRVTEPEQQQHEVLNESDRVTELSTQYLTEAALRACAVKWPCLEHMLLCVNDWALLQAFHDDNDSTAPKIPKHEMSSAHCHKALDVASPDAPGSAQAQDSASALNSAQADRCIFKHLKYISLRLAPSITSLAPAVDFSHYILAIFMVNCSGISDLTPLTLCPKLITVTLRNEHGVSDLTPLARCSMLKHISDISGCRNVMSLTDFSSECIRVGSGKNLTELVMMDCPGIIDLSSLRLRCFPRLRVLESCWM
ncbi:hypothetical protein CEUSTIGMA_g10369.t1 [Chlamydomonas eustigma]|uniref:Uncharacterized protein n=1 Tax=Chlamydomonas eustigma TaxID=1157962 RepID=A0A250XJ52_9CHLO|nr:hypothetical protein CEUSTIGMA_g10369.t1 [Chlamydomonas eustigma]|eukprot:GAX82942.1 hypothetical protein CEUSTIGMA_g10369.t1 [Chlamydomonas eustigma]